MHRITMHFPFIVLLYMIATSVGSLGRKREDKQALYVNAIASCLDHGRYPCKVRTNHELVGHAHEDPYAKHSYNYGYGYGMAIGSGHSGLIPSYHGVQVSTGYRTNPAASIEVTEIMCIHKYQLCDGINNCPLNDDEGDCPVICSSSRGEVKCGHHCAVPCNGIIECPDGQDEINCAVCTEDEIGCKLVKTHELGCAKRCDKNTECENGMDEYRCLPQCDDDEIICPQEGKKDQYQCARPCDGNKECPHGEDEKNCRKKYTENKFSLSAQIGCPGCEMVDWCEMLRIRGIINEEEIPQCRELFDNTICRKLRLFTRFLDAI